MTRVALMLDVLGDGRGSTGNVRHLLEIGRELRALGHEPVLVGHDHDPSAAFEQLADGIELRAVNVGPVSLPVGRRAILDRYWSGMRRMAELVADVDVVNPYDWPSLRAGRLAAQRLGVPMVWTRNDDTIWERALIPERTARGQRGAAARAPRLAFGLLDLRDARAAQRIVVLSEHDAAMVRRAYGRRAEVLRIGPAPRFFDSPDHRSARQALGIPQHRFLVLAVALLVPHRRLEDLIDAAARVPGGSAHVLIVGSDHLLPAYGRELATRIEARGLTDRVTLRRESVSDPELRSLYAAADVYVFPSSRQSYGQAPLEALAAGTPVIVSAGAGVSEVLRDRPGVRVVAPRDPDALATAIGQLEKAGPEAGREGAQVTREWLRRELTNAAYAHRMAELYADALAHRRSGRGAS